MVRVITGTLLDVGAGRRAPDDVAAMLAARDRREAGTTAPPQGLVLAGVTYADFSSGSPHFSWPPAAPRGVPVQ
jgi:tRNA pseudouridine38-40 synthase